MVLKSVLNGQFRIEYLILFKEVCTSKECGVLGGLFCLVFTSYGNDEILFLENGSDSFFLQNKKNSWC